MKINSKKGKTNYLNQKGITLIALVVTIVVLLILAGVSINTVFSENGIIARAKNAQDKIDQATQNELDTIDELNDWVNSKTTGENTPPVEPTEDTAPYYPDNTFTKLKGTDLSNGLVIKDKEGNEYVWIEVPKSLYNNEAYNKDTEETDIDKQDKKPKSSIDYNNIEYCLHKYTETYRKGTDYSDTYSSEEATGLISEQYTALKQKMLKSVYENGGFWIGRYEAGIAENRTSKNIDLETAPAPLSKAGIEENPVYPYTYVTCSQAQTLASKLSTGKDYTSSLMFGVQWDLVLKHIETKIGSSNLTTSKGKNILTQDSSSWGNYSDASFEINRGKYAKYGALSTWYDYNNENGLEKCVTYANGMSTKNLDLNNFENSILLTTGASDTCKKMNIYDLAGNVEEYTLESGTVSTTKPCICRGSFFYYSGSYHPAAQRLSASTIYSRYDNGFRLSLYK